MDDNVRDRVEDALRGHDARYVEVRVEEVTGTHIRYRGKELDEIGHTAGLGGCVRALAGGWGFASFNDLDGLREKVATAVRNARLVEDKEVGMAAVEPVVDTVPGPRREGPPGCPTPGQEVAPGPVRGYYLERAAHHDLHGGLR